MYIFEGGKNMWLLAVRETKFEEKKIIFKDEPVSPIFHWFFTLSLI